MVYAVVRVRGQPDVNRDIEFTMQLLGVNKVNHCVFVPEDASTKGMLQVAKDYITWGEVDSETAASVLKGRGKVVGDYALTDDYLKENSEFADIDALAKAVVEGRCKLKDVEGVKPVVRLHPPVKGYEGNKRSYQNGGALGYRGAAINDLLKRMI